MPPPTPKPVTFGWGWITVGAAGVIAAGTAAAFLRPILLPQQPTFVPVPSKPPVAAVPVAPEAPAPQAATPHFDVVRITPEGDAVIAGRAAPGTDVTVREGTAVVGTARAGMDGTWILTPSAPLRPGAGALTVAGPDGKPGPDSVVISIPATAAKSAPLAVLTTTTAAPKVLQIPGAPQSNRLAVQALDYGQSGEVRFAGRAPPKSAVRVYVDNKPVGESRADPDGAWALSAGGPMSPGVHRLRVDQLGTSGRVVTRIELPFSREAEPDRALAAGNVIVQPGQSLWRIARSTYGEGIRYTVIYDANHEEIRDPNRIYPGQVFAVPQTP